MIPIVTTINSIEDVKGYKTIADITVDNNDEVILYIYDSNFIVISVISEEHNNNRIFILTKVDDFYIKEKEIFLDGVNHSDKNGINLSVTKHDKKYILALADTYYKTEDGEIIGCVFLYKFISGKGWCCIKELTSFKEDSEFGNYLEFTEDGLIVGFINNNEQNFYLYRTNNFKHFNKEKIEYDVQKLYSKLSNYDNIFFVMDEYNNKSDGVRKFRLRCTNK